MMGKTWAIVDLLERFQLGAVLSARQVADNYRVTVRTAERWLAECAENADVEAFPDPASQRPTRLLWRRTASFRRAP